MWHARVRKRLYRIIIIYYLLQDAYLSIMIKWVVGKCVTLMMIMSENSNYVLNNFGKWRVMITRTEHSLPHGLWVLVTSMSFNCDIDFGYYLQRVFLRDQLINIGDKKMGGKQKRIELASCKEWKKKKEIWKIL